MKKFCAVSQLANKQLEKIEECTEKTPSQQQVWDQRQRMKKILQKTKMMTQRLDTLCSRWRSMKESESSDKGLESESKVLTKMTPVFPRLKFCFGSKAKRVL